MPESHLQLIVESAVDGIVFMEDSGQVTLFNPACERMFGYAADEIVGGDVKQLMPEPYHGEHDGYLENHRRTGEKKIIGIGREVVGRRKNGDTFPLHLSVGEAQHDGQSYYVGILRDLTERKRIDDLRELFIEQLTASNLERTHFVHVASHDLREPLRMMAAFCGLLSKNYGDRLDERGREYLALALSSATQMQALLDDLVDFGRLGLEVERGSWFDSSACLDKVIENLHDAIEVAGGEITREGLERMYGNPIRFTRLMGNLIGNALKYVEPGVTPRIHVSAVREGEFWRLSVSDNGIGIAARHHARVFEPFKRLHTKSIYSGTGLGLAICRKIVGGFGGRIWVDSTAGEGSTFSFTLKIHDEERDDGQPDD